ncbi:MAG TPA: tyrosine-type recombinase/integrase [Ktedonobacteraceae bacterium]|nr:tyrosine-type recombinase/integrase [Ktedonobacteraceae bacterium]
MARSRRRANGEGSVFQRKDGRWVMQIWLGDKYKQTYVKSQKEGIQALKKAQQELEQGTLATGPRRKLGEYVEDWLENVHKDKLRLSTYVKYKKLIKYIVAELGNVWLQKLTPEQVQRFYTKLGKKKEDGGRGLSPKTIHEVHGVLHLALKNAVRWSLISRNVCDLVSPPRLVKPDIKPLTMEQAKNLLEVVRGHRLETLLTMALTTGMRRGELLALRWSDVNLEEGTVIVKHTVDYIARYGYVENEAKTEAGRRMIILPAFVVDMLKKHRVQQLELRLKAGDSWQNLDLVFTGLHGGYFNPRYMPKLFNKVLVEAGLPHICFHNLRHSAATLLLSMGVNIKMVQEILGHSDIVVTLGIYGHLLPAMHEEAMSKWDDKLNPNGQGNKEVK